MLNVTVRLANLESSADQVAVLQLLDMYSNDRFGSGEPLAEDVRTRLVPELRKVPGCRIFLAFLDERPIGLATCFLGFSSFRAMPLLNVHDLAVEREYRGKGVGRALLQAAEDEARRFGCCRLTLEVRADNTTGQRLYRQFGFDAGEDETDTFLFWKKSLD